MSSIRILILIGITALTLGASELRVERAPDDGIQPRLQYGPDGVLHLITAHGPAPACDVHYRRCVDGEWSAPLRVNSQDGSAVVAGSVRGPALAVGRAGIVHVAWMGSQQAEPKAPGGHTPMLYARLDTGADAFSAQRNLIDNAHGLDGGGSVAADAQGNVWVVWHGEGGAGATERRVYLRHSSDDGARFGGEQSALSTQTGACPCCGISAGASTDGALAVVYRAAMDGGRQRDLQLLFSPGPGRDLVRSTLSPWQINGCPMSTSSIALGSGDGLLAWQQKEQVFMAALELEGSALGEAIPAPGAGNGRKHPVAARNDAGEICFAWTEGTGWNKGGSLHWVRFDAAGEPIPDSAGSRDDLPVWGLPALVADGDDFLLMY